MCLDEPAELKVKSALNLRPYFAPPTSAKDGKVVCFFQSARKFKTKYATFGFMHEANLDEGDLWPNAFTLKELTAAEEARIGALVKKAVSWGLSNPMATERASSSSMPALASPSRASSKITVELTKRPIAKLSPRKKELRQAKGPDGA